MFKLPDGIPSLQSSAQDWADYAEYSAWKNGNDCTVSLRSLIKASSMISDEEDVLGINDDTDKFISKFDEIAQEINYRNETCRDRYPFMLVSKDYGISYSPTEDYSHIIYRYLLMSTRVNMSRNRTHADIDGALLFECLSAIIAKNFFGERANTCVFGTSKSNAGGFRTRLKNLVVELGEGGDIHENKEHKPQDEKVDIVVWKGFKDRLSSQMIAFGQCKTGTSWSDKLSELNPDIFCKTWFTRQPVLTPVRLFFCSQDFPRNIWDVRANNAGLVFDRFRIIDYLPEKIDEELLEKIQNWTDTAFHSSNQ